MTITILAVFTKTHVAISIDDVETAIPVEPLKHCSALNTFIKTNVLDKLDDPRPTIVLFVQTHFSNTPVDHSFVLQSYVTDIECPRQHNYVCYRNAIFDTTIEKHMDLLWRTLKNDTNNMGTNNRYLFLHRKSQSCGVFNRFCEQFLPSTVDIKQQIAIHDQKLSEIEMQHKVAAKEIEQAIAANSRLQDGIKKLAKSSKKRKDVSNKDFRDFCGDL